MFEKFGEFDSVEELNMAAEGFLKEGDIESLIALAEENGIDKEDAQDYADGMVDSLATESSAAFGRLEVEQREINSKENNLERMPYKVILTMLKGMCTDKGMMAAVMRKGKRVSEIFELMKSEAGKHKSGNIGISCGTDRELCEIVKAYYLSGKDACTEIIKKLYK